MLLKFLDLNSRNKKIKRYLCQTETVAKVNSLTILLARLSRLCRKDEAQGAEGEV